MFKRNSKQSRVCKGVQWKRGGLRWEGFVKKAGSEPGVKKWRNYG